MKNTNLEINLYLYKYYIVIFALQTKDYHLFIFLEKINPIYNILFIY